MRHEIRAVTTYVSVYYANDGTEFADRAQCEEYEKKCTEILTELAKIEKCDAAQGLSPLDGGEFMEYHDYTWYRPKNREEATLLYTHFHLEFELDDDEIGQWICIEDNTDCECWAYPIAYSIDHIKKFLKAFGYKFTIEEDNDNV